MKVFSLRFLEPLSGEKLASLTVWKWQPYNKDIVQIYASGSKTATQQSTYASEKDNESDTDRPNEGK